MFKQIVRALAYGVVSALLICFTSIPVAHATVLWDFTVTSMAYIPSGYDSYGRGLPYTGAEEHGLESVTYRYDPDRLVTGECDVFVDCTQSPCNHLYSCYWVEGPVLSVHYSGLINGGSGPTSMVSVVLLGTSTGTLFGGSSIQEGWVFLPDEYRNPVESTRTYTAIWSWYLEGGEDGFRWDPWADEWWATPTYRDRPFLGIWIELTLSPVPMPEPGVVLLFCATLFGLGVTARSRTGYVSL